MTQAVNVPGVGTLQFPDGMSQPDMAAAIQKNYPQIHAKAPAAPKPVAPFQQRVGRAPENAHEETVSRLFPENFAGTQSPPLGPWASAAARPIAKGLGGIGTAIPDFATQVANLVPEKVGGVNFGPKLQSPGGLLNQWVDQGTTAPQGRAGQIAEDVSTMLVGGMGGPKMSTTPNSNPIVKRLAQEGVTMTPGQRAGGLANTLEEKASKILPPIGNARAKAVEQWNTARLSEALKDAKGAAVPRDMTGRDAIRHTYQQLQNRYQSVLGKMKADLNAGPQGSRLPTPAGQAWQPGSLREAVEKVRSVGANLDPSQRGTLNDVIDNQVIGKFTRQGRASGETIKEIEETLRTEAEKHESLTYQDRKLSQALYQLRADLKAALQRENPKLASELEGVDRGYAKYKLSARASNYRQAGSGNYTPGQRLQAVRERDATKDRNAFSTGTARGQAEAEEAQSILGNTQPDSGTPMGTALLSALGIGMGGGAVGHAGAAVPYLGALGGSAAAYSQPVLKWLQDRGLNAYPELLSKLGIAGAAQQSQAGP